MEWNDVDGDEIGEKYHRYRQTGPVSCGARFVVLGKSINQTYLDGGVSD
jgi:hypothetical protein